MDNFTRGYIDCALWSSNDDKGTPLDEIDVELSANARASIIAECAEFQRENAALLEEARADGRGDEFLGHDFWLTRNRHGAGYWDGRVSEALGKALTDAAHRAGERTLYISDANEIEYI